MAQRKNRGDYPQGETKIEGMIKKEWWDYKNKKGETVCRVTRFESPDGSYKKFPTARVKTGCEHLPDSDESKFEPGWPEEEKRVLYGPKLIWETNSDTVYIMEGERCTDHAFDIGLPAFCNMGGASRRTLTPTILKPLKDKRCIVMADNDPAGRRHAREWRYRLNGIAKECNVVYFPELKASGDIKDLIAERGADAAKSEINRRADMDHDLQMMLRSSFGQRDELMNAFKERWRVSKPDVKGMLKELMEDIEHGEVENLHGDSEIGEDGRIMFPMPHSKAEFGPIMKRLDSILCNVDAIEPPMRSSVTEVPFPCECLERAPSLLHLLSQKSANGECSREELEKMKPPKTHIMVQHTENSMHIEVEKYICCYEVVKKGRHWVRENVAFPSKFLNAYMEYRDSKLPLVRTIATMPMVLRDGTVIKNNGLYREYGLLCRMEEGIAACIPVGRPTNEMIRSAIRFLLDEWLVDVVVDDIREKYKAIALCLSIIERPLFNERPGYVIKAAKRGGGKTTLINMISTAILGIRASAVAWSKDEEEQRKAIFALALQSVPMIVFDNIKQGTRINSSAIEAFITAAKYTDRELGKSETKTVESNAVPVFTGNNIDSGPEMISRLIDIVIAVHQVNPEERTFVHDFPIEWTMEHRKEILAALYTILLGNPRLYGERLCEPKTRFKGWWEMDGAALEYAAELCGVHLDFSDVFRAAEEAEEHEEGSLYDFLNLMVKRDKYRLKGKDYASDDRVLYAKEIVAWLSEASSLPPDQKATVQNFFSGEGDYQHSLNAKSVGIMLRSHLNAPVRWRDQTVFLRTRLDHAKTKTYYVELECELPPERM